MPLDPLLRGNDDSWGYVIIHTIVISAQAEVQCALALSVLGNGEIQKLIAVEGTGVPLDSLLRGNDDSWGYMAIHSWLLLRTCG